MYRINDAAERKSFHLKTRQKNRFFRKRKLVIMGMDETLDLQNLYINTTFVPKNAGDLHF
ncbi:hypothetical protein B2I22_18615 [Bacillus spizizenii]|nr:hypothetical protein B2I22_18615 [Bacillus spizizenii]OWV36926.1 hypothetical protein CE489_11275 [Bacillus spizizenii]